MRAYPVTDPEFDVVAQPFRVLTPGLEVGSMKDQHVDTVHAPPLRDGGQVGRHQLRDHWDTGDR